jgi:hypothetical protein
MMPDQTIFLLIPNGVGEDPLPADRPVPGESADLRSDHLPVAEQVAHVLFVFFEVFGVDVRVPCTSVESRKLVSIEL